MHRPLKTVPFVAVSVIATAIAGCSGTTISRAGDDAGGEGGATRSSSGGKASGGTTASGGKASGGTTASGGKASGGTTANGGNTSGGTTASGGNTSGGTSATASSSATSVGGTGTASGGQSTQGGTASGGQSTQGGTASGGTTMAVSTTTSTVTTGRCGDAVVNAVGEECDYGSGNVDTGACTSQCKTAVCGDGLVQSGKEQCDGRGATATCDADCTPPACGDGVTNRAAGETCDDGADNGKFGKCHNDCRFVCEGACPIRVDSAIATAGDGTSWASAMKSLTTAIDTQQDRGGGQIWVKISEVTGPITLKRGVLVYGGFSGTEALLASRPLKQYSTLSNGTAVVTGASNSRLDGFIVTGGNANKMTGAPQIDGGGMLNRNVSGLVVANCRFQNNTAAGKGGAMYNYSSSVRIEDVVFAENTAVAGGAIYNEYIDSLNSVQILRSRFEKNTAATGGALYNSNADPAVSDSVFESNRATSSSPTDAQGGAVYNTNSAPSFVNVVFNKNSAFTGGAILSTSTVTKTPRLINSLITGNTNSDSSGSGGLLDLASAGTVITNSTIALNSGPGGLNLIGTATTRCTNCVVVASTSVGTNHNLSTSQFVKSCAVNYGIPMGAPPNPFVSPAPDLDGDGILDLRLTQLDSNPCVNKGDDAAASAVGIPWATLTTGANGCLDQSPVDAGYHYPTTSSLKCN